MLIQDDGRASLPRDLAAGDSCRVSLTIEAPAQAGAYQVECDVVHEGISWFADKGSATWKRLIVVEAGGQPANKTGSAIGFSESSGSHLPERLDIPADAGEELAPFPMHGIQRDTVEQFVREHDGELLHVETDEKCGKEWVGYRYFVRKRSRA
jgi:hypothetical protein